MTDKKAAKPVSFAQLEEVLEERQSERRREDKGPPSSVTRERRKLDRRAGRQS